MNSWDSEERVTKTKGKLVWTLRLAVPPPPLTQESPVRKHAFTETRDTNKKKVCTNSEWFSQAYVRNKHKVKTSHNHWHTVLYTTYIDNPMQLG